LTAPRPARPQGPTQGDPGRPPLTAPPADPPWLCSPALEISSLILQSYRQAWGRPLLALPASAGPRLAAQELFGAATVVAAHDGGDPRLIYANRAALSLWRRDWAAMVGMPSRLTAEPCERAARSIALAEALDQGRFSGYSGIRVDSSGRRFRIRNARLWTLWDSQGQPCGQGACFADWCWL
jgi:hypothetical protein